VGDDDDDAPPVEESTGRGGGNGGHRKPLLGESSSTTGSDLNLKALVETLRSLLQKLLALGGTPSPELLVILKDQTPTPTYTRNLDLGDVGDDVRALQVFLIAQNKGPAAQALAINGATGYFGPLTQAALAEYQAAVGITPAAGYFGPMTRANVNNVPVQ
jgi:peptidoglycan hydrolase-like protein with peptidoglycan-binding domain